VVARRNDVLVGASSVETGVVDCLPGERAVDGGAGISGILTSSSEILFDEPREADGSEPEDGEVATGWRAVAANAGVNPRVMNVHVLCACPERSRPCPRDLCSGHWLHAPSTARERPGQVTADSCEAASSPFASVSPSW
jgi:hypothetical protein